MPQQLRQSSAVAKFGGATSASNTLTVLAGSDIVVTGGVDSFAGSGLVLTITDGVAYSQDIVELFDSSNQAGVFIARHRNLSAGTYTVTATTTNGAGYGQMMSHEVTGNANLGVDKTSGNTANTSTTPTSGSSGTLSLAAEIIFAVVGNNGTDFTGLSTPSGFTNLYRDTSATEFPCSFDFMVVSATTAVNAAWGTTNTASWWAAALASYQGASAPTGTSDLYAGLDTYGWQEPDSPIQTAMPRGIVAINATSAAYSIYQPRPRTQVFYSQTIVQTP